MALPKAVQRQVDEANQIAAEAAKLREAPPADPPAEPPAPPANDGAPPTPPPAAKPEPEAWEQKYKVLQGKYNAEVPRLQRTVTEQADALKELRQQVTAQQMMLASLHQQRGAAPAGQGGAPAAPTKLVKDEEVKEFGEDLTDFIRRVAKETVLPDVDSRLKPVQQQVEQVRGMTEEERQRATQAAHERLLQTLDREVDGWRDTNNDPSFHEWLAKADPYSGMTRQQLLTQAYEHLDAPRIVMFFKGYRNEHAAVTPSTPPPPAQPAAQRTLEDYVAPGTAKTGTVSAQDGAGKRIYTQAEIKQFYDHCAAGKYRTNQERRNQIEQDIMAAVREGRVR